MVMNKIGRCMNVFLVISMILFFIPAMPTLAETPEPEEVVFLSDAGSDENSGEAPDSAFKSLARAYQALGDGGGTIVVSGSFGFGPFTEPVHTGEVTITQVYNGTDYRINPSNPADEGNAFYTKTAGRFVLNGPTRFENIHFKAGEGSYLLFVAQANPITMAQGVTCTGFANNRVDRAVSILGGYQAGSGSDFPAAFNPSITIESGSFILVGFNRQVTTTHTGTAAIRISGGEIATLYGGSLNAGWGGSLDLIITGGRFTGIIHAGGAGNTVFAKGNVSVKITGGDFTLCPGIDGVVGEGVSYLDVSGMEDGWEALVEKAVNFTTIKTPDGEIGGDIIVEPEDVFEQNNFIDSQGTILPYRYYLPENYNPNKKYPLLLYMHGLGSRGNDNILQLTSSGAAVVKKVINSDYKDDAIILAPQCPVGEQWVANGKYPGSPGYNLQEPMSTYLSAAWELVQKTISDYTIDQSRIYATGSSNGGGAVWSLAARNPEFFAAIVPLAGTGEVGGAATVAENLASTPIWTFHGDIDEVLSVEGTRGLAAAIGNAGGNITYTELPGVNHGGCWPAAAGQEGLLDWMYSQVRLSDDTTGRVVYISDNGNDANPGTASEPVETLEAAYNILGLPGGTIVLCDRYELPSAFKEPNHRGAVTITTHDGSTDYAASGAALVFPDKGSYILSGPATFKEVTISYTGEINFIANFNPITFDTGVTTISEDINTPNIYVVGGHYAPQSSDNVPLNLDSNITIKSGTLYRAICGFTRVKGSATLTYTGTSHINVEGGTIAAIYGASLENHYSGSTVINIRGGTIGTVYSGGDATRRLNGTAEIGIFGGTVNTVNINNVVGNATLTLDGGTLENATVSYGNSTIEALCASSIVTLRYNSMSYTESQVTILGEKFDFIIPYGSVYVKKGAAGDGKSEATPTGSLNTALSMLGEGGGTVEVIGEYTLPSDFLEPVHTSEIRISGYDENSRLIFPQNSKYTLSGALIISDITIQNDGALIVDANNNKLTLGEGCTMANPSGVSIMGGASADGNTNITVAGSVIGSVYAHACNTEGGVLSGNSLVTILNGHVENIYTLGGTAIASGKEIVQILGGSVGNIVFYNAIGDVELRLMSGSAGTIDVEYKDSATEAMASGLRSLYFNKQKYSQEQISAVSHLFTAVSGAKAVFVADGGIGDGSSSYTPVGSLTDAVRVLGEEGGVIVPSGPVTVNETFSLPSYANLITFTSVFGGVDYSEANNARLLIGGSMFLGGPTRFSDIVIEQIKASCSIYCNGFDTVFDTGIRSEKRVGVSNYISVNGGGYQASTTNDRYTLTINSGRYNVVRGGHADTASVQTGSAVNVVINGGEFYSYFCAAGDGAVTGDTSLIINDGEFFAGVYGSANNGTEFNGNLTITLNGGIFHSAVSPAASAATVMKGRYLLTMNGGDFKSATEIKGTENIPGGMQAAINISEDIDINKEESGEITFTNYLRPGADPWVFFHDGYYYMTITGSTQISVFKAVNLSDLATAPAVPVFKPEPGHMYSRNLWSPEIHYFPAEDFGEENEGWYMFIACDDGDNNNHRMFVLKSLSGDPMGPYGHPVTGEVNVPVSVISKDDPEINTGWCAGQTVLRYNGDIYTLWIGEVWEELSETETRRYQVEYISKMENPWTMIGQKGIICVPTEDWEKNGATTSGSKIYPEVVEGGTAVYGPNGEVYVIYSGSGYWTVHYQLGQLKLIGDDPLVYENWEKTTTPIFSKSDEVNGCGHASYTVSPDGNTRWIVYHAYTGRDTQSGRFVFVEPYTVDSEKVVIGNGSTHPQPINTEMTIQVNPMPLAKKLVGWENALPSVAAIEIIGDDSISVKIGSTAVVNFTAEVKDQNGLAIPGETVSWAVYNQEGNVPAGLSIDNDGVLNISSAVAEGRYTIKAFSASNPLVTGTKSFSIKILIPEQPSEPSTEGSTPVISTPSESQTVAVSGGKTELKVTGSTLDAGTKKASIAIEAKKLVEALSAAKVNEEGIKTVVINVAAAAGAQAYEVKLPAAVFTQEPVDSLIEIRTRTGSILVPSTMLKTSGLEKGEHVSFTFTQIAPSDLSSEVRDAVGNRPVIDISVAVDGISKRWSGPNSPVTVLIPYKPTEEELVNSENLVVWYIDDNGMPAPVYNSKFVAPDSMVFTTAHFSKYAVIYNVKSFADIGKFDWAKKQIEVLAAKGIIEGTSETEFRPEMNITRADFITLLIRTLGLTAAVDSNFDDISKSDYFYESAAIAKKLGIAQGVGNNKFNPGEQITRQDMMTITARALKLAKKLKETDTTVLDAFEDTGKVAPYAVQSIAELYKAGLVKGDGNILNPEGNATRAETAVLMYRILNQQ